MQGISISIVADATEAVERGHIYHDGFTELKVKSAVIVKKGTVEGSPTVDFICEDKDGKKYVFMITGNLLKSIPC